MKQRHAGRLRPLRRAVFAAVATTALVRPSPAQAPPDSPSPQPTPAASVTRPLADTSDPVPPLIRQLGSTRWPDREAAVWKLIDIGAPAVGPLEVALSDPDAETRGRVARVLDGIRWGLSSALRSRAGDLPSGFGDRPAEERRGVLPEILRRGAATAIPFFAAVVRREDDEATLALALGCLERLDPDRAEQALEEAARSPGGREWHAETLGRRRLTRGDTGGALAAYESARDRGQDRLALRVGYAAALERAGRFEDALRAIEGPIGGGWDAFRDTLRGRLLSAAGRYTEALVLFETELQAIYLDGNRNRPELYACGLRIAECLRRLGRPEEIEERWRAILRRETPARYWKMDLSELLRRDGKLERGDEVWREWVAGLAPDEDYYRRYAEQFRWQPTGRDAPADGRRVVVVPYRAGGYRYLVVPVEAGAGFEAEGFDDAGFAIGQCAFGTISLQCNLNNPLDVATPWEPGTDILVRREIDLPAGTAGITVAVAIDNDVQVFINGRDISGGVRRHEGCPGRDDFRFTAPGVILKPGANLLAVRGKDRGTCKFLDIEVGARVGGGGREAEAR